MSSVPKINVVIRKRPLSKKECASNDVDICEVRNRNNVIIRELKYNPPTPNPIGRKLT